MTGLPFMTIAEARAAILSGQITVAELTELMLTRIEQLNPQLLAINLLTASLAREAVGKQSADSKAALAGIPVVNKDAFALAGVKTTAGVPQLKDYVPGKDAVAVQRLKEAGAIFLGQTNVPYMLSDHVSENEIYGRSNNPWDLSRTPGGSTGGGAAAVAAGLGYLSLGSDIGGSIRIPAHFCGVYGHKPTINLVPLTGHIPPAPWIPPQPKEILPVAGPLARSAKDLLLALSVLGGFSGDEAVAYQWKMPPPRRTSLQTYKIGYVVDDPLCPVSRETITIMQKAVAALERAGATLVEGWPEGVDPARQYYTYRYLLNTVFAFDMRDDSEADLREKGRQPGNESEQILARAWTDNQKSYQVQTSYRMVARAAWQAFFRNYDAFLLPTAFQPAFPHPTERFNTRVHLVDGRERKHEEMLFWISFATLTGLPATTAPAGHTRGGLPVGLQIIGPYLEDATPIDIADRLSELLGGFVPPPGYV